MFEATADAADANLNWMLVKARASGAGVEGLYLADLGLKKIPENLSYWSSFTELQSLMLHGNNLQSIPAALVALRTLTTVTLSGNPLGEYPVTLRLWGRDLHDHLQAILIRAEEFRDRRIVLIGEEGVGKCMFFSSATPMSLNIT